jgi:hypothetical protein
MPMARANTVSEAFRVASAHPEDQSAVAALETYVRNYVIAARAHEWPPEKTLIELKHLLRASGLAIGHSADTSPAARREHQLYEQVIGWCIQFYYTPPRSK